MVVAVSFHPERLIHRDSASYIQPAVNLLAGHGFSQASKAPFAPDAQRTPVYPLFIALLYCLFGEQNLAIAAVQALLGAMTAGLTYLLARHLVGERGAFIGGLCLALSLGPIVYTAYILTEILSTLLLVSMTLALVLYLQKARLAWLVGCGLLAGLAILCRPITLGYPLLCALLLGLAHRGEWRRVLVAALALLGTAGLTIAPWVVRNVRVVGLPTVSTINDVNLFLYDAVALKADLEGVAQESMRTELMQRAQDILAQQGQGQDVVARDRLYRKWGREIILAHPWRYLYIHVKSDVNGLFPNVTEFLELAGVTRGAKGTLSVLNQYGLWAAVRHYFGPQSWLLCILLPFIALLALVYGGVLAGAVALVRRRAWIALAVLSTPVMYFLLIPGPAAHPRFRVPVEPYICSLAGVGLAAAWTEIRQRSTRPAKGCQSRPERGRDEAETEPQAGSPSEVGRVRVLQVITRLIVGGAQETAILIAEMLDPMRFTADLVCGPQTGTEGSLIEDARGRGIHLLVEPTLVREVNPAKDLLALVRLVRLIRRGRYDIVHTHSSKAGILGRVAAWLAGTPVVVHTVHGWGHNDHQHPLVQRVYICLEKLALPITDRLIAVSPVNVEKGLRDGIGRAEDYVVIRSGIDLDRFGHPRVPRDRVRAALGLAADVPVVGSVTRLSPQKAPLDLVRAAAVVAQSVPEAAFIVVGDGPLRPELEALIAELGLGDRFVLTGLRDDVPELMAAFDVFVLSSLWEGLPRVLPQAMAAGLPIVATAADGSAEAVHDGVNGRLTPPGDPEALARAIVELLRDPQQATRMGQAGLARASEFGARRMVEQVTDLYEELMTRKGRV